MALIASDTLIRGMLTSTTAAAILFPLIVRLAKREFDIFEPVVPATLALSSMFVVRPLVDQVTSSYIHLGFNISPTFDEALLAVLVGCIAFSSGYLSNLVHRFGECFRIQARSFPDKEWSRPRSSLRRWV